MERDVFETAYRGQAPWDIPGPQPAFVGLEESGEIRGAVLDLGCGTGENALYLAGRGHEVWGVDFVPVAVERATTKAAARGLGVHFRAADALDLSGLGRQFDTAIDSGLFHTFGDPDRAAYVASLSRVLRPGGRVHVLCFSDREPPGEGPRRVTQQEIRDAFGDGWRVEAIRESFFRAVDDPASPRFSPGGPRAWLATVIRDGGGPGRDVGSA